MGVNLILSTRHNQRMSKTVQKKRELSWLVAYEVGYCVRNLSEDNKGGVGFLLRLHHYYETVCGKVGKEKAKQLFQAAWVTSATGKDKESAENSIRTLQFIAARGRTGSEKAKEMLELFRHAKVPEDKAQSYALFSRMLDKSGENAAAA